MRTFILLLITIVFLSCNSQTEVKTNDNSVHADDAKLIPDCNVAVKFINDYTEFTSSKKAADDSAWIAHNPLLTGNFKLTYKNLLDSARKADPELGLDFDPIFDAQDYPNKGFELNNCDSTAGYVSVRGKDWKEFILALKVIHQNDQWLVDGAGVDRKSVV